MSDAYFVYLFILRIDSPCFGFIGVLCKLTLESFIAYK